ncbi:Cdc7p-Dbf4p kinase complex regulatory subunit [Dipsacomyces acuminosporus]|nr:Cdc7p-Dbf4p kinase complex regulatory subunit [Dipsacomyces acuminosporus]
MASRKLTFDASKSSGRSLGASPAARNILATTSQQHPFMSPTRSLATPTRPSQRATLARMQQARRDLAALGNPAQSTPVTRSTGIARRNPLQAITKREQQRSNLQHGNTGNEHANQKLTRSNENAVSTATAHAALTPDQQRQQKARVAEWIYAYRRAFPSFVFYFEGIDESTVRRLSVPVRSLGAKVETFFSAQTVTHVVVESPAMASDENASKSSHVVSLAKRFHLKIWDLDKLENRVLMFLLPGYSASNTQSPSVLSAKRKLNEAFSAEKMYAMRHKAFEGNSVAHCVDFYHFKYFYVLVEDAAHLHRPAIVEDFRPPEPGRDPPWPKLYMVPAGRCPFVQYEDPTTSSKGSESDGEENKENATPEPEATTLPTMQLLSKTPASRRQTPRRKAWTPTATRTGAECISGNGKPSATVQTSRTHEAEALTAAANDADFVTPTRPPRSNAAPLFGATAAAGKSGDVSQGDGGNNSLGDARPPQTASASLCAAVHSANIVPITPTPQRLGTADSSIASLISSLETPKFQAAVAARTSYDDGATLFGEGFDYHSRQRSTLDSQYSFQTPTRPSFQHLSRDLAAAAEASSGRTPVDGISATADHSGFLQEPIGGSTLIQPSRAVSKLGTTAGGKKAGANAEYLRHEVNEETQATN